MSIYIGRSAKYGTGVSAMANTDKDYVRIDGTTKASAGTPLSSAAAVVAQIEMGPVAVVAAGQAQVRPVMSRSEVDDGMRHGGLLGRDEFEDGWNAAIEAVIRRLSTERGDVHEIKARVAKISQMRKYLKP